MGNESKKGVQKTAGNSGLNRLANEKSPYLIQHAGNPVDWYPWGEEAFEKARREDKPILLSIGYATCHWCHVMAHESFEDPEVADLINETFVAIKLDREERPDIDNIYMIVCQLMTGSGGWPLTIVMTPDKKPFFAGTYFPRKTAGGRIGMLDLIPRIRDVWVNRREEVIGSANDVCATLMKFSEEHPGEASAEDLMKAAFSDLSQRFDLRHGGFMTAPKFPTTHNLLFLLRYWKRTGDNRALRMVEKTLTSMRLGGIYDHLGFGFHRYSTDEKWLTPHFEKMLYDQALAVMAYTEAYQATGNIEYMKTAREIIAYVLRDMTSPEGGFYSAQDADSEGVEGKFYLWTEEEIFKILGERDGALAAGIFNIRPDGNFDSESTGQKTGANILHMDATTEIAAARMEVRETELADRIETIRQRLFAEREKRVHPFKDDKVLADWNGIMIAALAKAARVFDEPSYGEAAEKAANFILDNMSNEKGRLLHRFRDGEAAAQGNADDYAFMVWGLIELYETTFKNEHLDRALKLNGHFMENFLDDQRGGFFFTPVYGEDLILRCKEVYDGATPSANSVAALNMMRLGRITENPELIKLAGEIAKAFSKSISHSPSAHTMMMAALSFMAGPSFEVFIAGEKDSEDTIRMLRTVNESYNPNAVVVLGTSTDGKTVGEISRTAIDNKATAYVCSNFNCKKPTTSPDELSGMLESW